MRRQNLTKDQSVQLKTDYDSGLSINDLLIKYNIRHSTLYYHVSKKYKDTIKKWSRSKKAGEYSKIYNKSDAGIRRLLSSKKRSRMKAVELLGGKCRICGSIEELQFHHLVYTKNECKGKAYTLSHRVLKQPYRFMLLCRTCHVLVGIWNKYPKKVKAFIESIMMKQADRNKHFGT